MKKILLLSIFSVSISFGGYVFSVKPGTLVPGNSQFGYLFGSRFNPYFGLEYLRFSTSYNYQEYYNGTLESESSGDVSLNLFMPNLGAKVFLSENEKLKPYLYGSGFLIIPFVSISGASPDDEAQVEDVFDLFGLQLGTGAEYFFHEHFSLGGEVGLYWFFSDFSSESGDNTQGSFEYFYKTDIKTHLGLTRTSMTLNYYF